MIALCTWCGTDEYVEDHDVINDVAYCTGPGHAEPRMFEPKKEKAATDAKNALTGLPDGIANELGMYEDLPLVLRLGEWAETGVVEYRYGISHPKEYGWMLDRWGHVFQSPRKFSVTSFVGSTLGDLSRSTNITHKPGPGTGLFSHNATLGYWTLQPVPTETVDMSWYQCATDVGLDPAVWPLA
jgi:hypothetical protein